MAHLVKSKTPDSDKNFWATTWECFADAQALYGRKFECDVAAEPLTSKCSKYFASPQIIDSLLRNRWETAVMLHHAETQLGNICIGLDALNLNWPEHWFCNPPFDLKGPFIGHAKWQQQQGRPGMMLLPYERQTDWWRKGIRKGCIIYEMEHTTDTVKCPHCKKEYKPDTPEAEFIGWHGLCAECELNGLRDGLNRRQ